MKRTVLFFMSLAISLNSLFANPIDSTLAKKVAINFYYQNSELKSLAEINANLTYFSSFNDGLKSNNPIITYYVITPKNFVFLAKFQV